MPASNRTCVLNLGMQTVTLAEFQTSTDGSLTLLQFHQTELMADPGADASRPGQLKVAVAQLMSAASIRSGTKVSYALPSQAVFARYLSLPGTTSQELDQIIAFEAQQNIPFPIDEVVWDYQAVGSTKDGRLNVVLLAIKTDTLEELTEAVESNGLRPQIIDVAPMALYNAFRYNHADLGGCSMLIDIGARTTNLIFIEGDKAYSRTIPIGGSSISTAIAKELEEHVERAEAIKRDRGVVGLGGAYADPEDAISARIAKLSRTTLTRLHADVARSISFYRANQGGSQPLRAYLAGGTVAMPYMLEFFAEKMQMPVDFFNPFQQVSIGASVDQEALARSAPALGETVGLASRSLGNCPVEINLRPPSVKRAHALERRKPFLIAAALCLFLAVGQWLAYFTQAAAVKGAVLDTVSAEVTQLSQYATRFDRAQQEQRRIEQVAAPLLAAAVEREAWIEIINGLGSKLPPDFIWVTRMTALSNNRPIPVGEEVDERRRNRNQQPDEPANSRRQTGRNAAAETPPEKPAIDAIQIDGLYLDNPNKALVIDDFVKNLQGSEVFEVPKEDSAKVVTTRTQPNDDTWAYAYTIILPLKNPIPLP